MCRPVGEWDMVQGKCIKCDYTPRVEKMFEIPKLPDWLNEYLIGEVQNNELLLSKCWLIFQVLLIKKDSHS